jgi:hypothetical protein
MPYELQIIEQNEHDLLCKMDGEAAERHGTIGYLRADFGQSGGEFWNTWFDSQKHLKTQDFKCEFNEMIEALRNDGQAPPFARRANLSAFCAENPSDGFKIQTLNYSYYFRCHPGLGGYDAYCFAYDNRYLLPELAGKHELPRKCFSMLPSTGERILIWGGSDGYEKYYPSGQSRDELRAEIDKDNAHFGVTRAQEEAMKAGSMLGWNTPAAKPWNYNENGRPRPLPPKVKNDPDRG